LGRVSVFRRPPRGHFPRGLQRTRTLKQAEPSSSTSGSSDAASSSASPGTSTTAEPSSASGSPTPAAKAYTNEDLTAIVTGLKDAQGRALTVVPAAQVDQGLIVARERWKRTNR